MKIVIIDYETGNTKSIYNILYHLKENDIKISKEKNDILNADLIILPGVGAFKQAMQKLKDYSLISILQEANEKNIFIFGICLGMQLLFERSFEFGETKGLALLSGDIVKLEAKKLPNIGWDNLKINQDSKLLKGINESDFFYFIHSYALIKSSEVYTLASSIYENNNFSAIIHHNNIFACQFHPEKSAKKGLKIISNLLSFVKERLENE